MPVRSSTLGDDVYTLTSVLAGFYVCNVAFDESEVLGGFFAYGGKYVVDIVLLAGGEVIQADYFLVFGEEKFNQVGAYEAGVAGYQPGFLGGIESFCEGLEWGHFVWLRMDSCLRGHDGREWMHFAYATALAYTMLYIELIDRLFCGPVSIMHS